MTKHDPLEELQKVSFMHCLNGRLLKMHERGKESFFPCIESNVALKKKKKILAILTKCTRILLSKPLLLVVVVPWD